MIPEKTVERIRAELLETALRAYEDAGIRGLCEEGRWEAAIDAMRSVDLTRTLDEEPEGPEWRR
jgi:hypothetical protein